MREVFINKSSDVYLVYMQAKHRINIGDEVPIYIDCVRALSTMQVSHMASIFVAYLELEKFIMSHYWIALTKDLGIESQGAIYDNMLNVISRWRKSPNDKILFLEANNRPVINRKGNNLVIESTWRRKSKAIIDNSPVIFFYQDSFPSITVNDVVLARSCEALLDLQEIIVGEYERWLRLISANLSF